MLTSTLTLACIQMSGIVSVKWERQAKSSPGLETLSPETLDFSPAICSVPDTIRNLYGISWHLLFLNILDSTPEQQSLQLACDWLCHLDFEHCLHIADNESENPVRLSMMCHFPNYQNSWSSSHPLFPQYSSWHTALRLYKKVRGEQVISVALSQHLWERLHKSL